MDGAGEGTISKTIRFFHTTMAREYDELHKAFDWDEGQFRKIARQ